MVANQIIFVARLKCRSTFAILHHNRIDEAKEIQFHLFQQGSIFGLRQCFPTFFNSRYRYFVKKIFDGTPNWFDTCKDQGILTSGGTLALAHGTLVCRGTPVGNHWAKELTLSPFSLKRWRHFRKTMMFTERLTDLIGQAKIAWWFSFRLEPIFDTAPAASKMMLALKVVKIDSKIIV